MHRQIEIAENEAEEPGRGDRGYVLALTALLIVPLMAFTGFAVDLGAWYARASSIQSATDAAALAGVTYLPDVQEAKDEAIRVAAKNGFSSSDPNITVTVEEIGNSRLRVTITDDSVDQYFTSLFTDQVTVERSSVAEFIRPVPMGSPRNYIGTGDILGDSGEAPREWVWMSVSGYCARREMGDRITTRTDSNGSSFDSCDPGTPPSPPTKSAVGANPEWRDYGYFYAIELDDGDATGGEAWPFPVRADVYDAGHCESQGSGAGDSGTTGSDGPYDTRSGQREYIFRLRSNDSNDPRQTSIIQETTVTPADCGTYADRWVSMGTITSPTEGTYYLQITPVEPTDQYGEDAQEGQNQMSLRAVRPTWVPNPSTAAQNDNDWPCTSSQHPSEAVTGAEEYDYCPQVYGLTHLGVYAFNNASQASFYLASVDDTYAGREMQVELFDTAEGAQYIEILDPAGNPVDFTWEIACQDSTYQSVSGSCTTGENPPDTPGYGPGNTNQFDVSGSVGDANRPWGDRNEQGGMYSDRLIRLTFQLPTRADNPTWYGGATWFKIRYSTCAGCGVGDRTTWSVSILGDPVRLIE